MRNPFNESAGDFGFQPHEHGRGHRHDGGRGAGHHDGPGHAHRHGPRQHFRRGPDEFGPGFAEPGFQAPGFTDPHEAHGHFRDSRMGPPFPPGGFPGHGFGPGGPGFGPGFGFGPGGRGMSGGRGRGVRGEGRGHGRGRARRGNVRAAVLTLLAERSMHGYEMIQEITQRSGGIWRPSPGSVYPTLQLLADEGMVTIEEGASGKRQYALTEAGQAEAAKHAQTPPWEQMAFDVDPTEIDLRSAFGQLATAAFQVSQAASSEQKSRATKALIEARQQMYLILAEAGVDPSDAEPSDTEPDLDDDSDDE